MNIYGEKKQRYNKQRRLRRKIERNEKINRRSIKFIKAIVVKCRKLETLRSLEWIKTKLRKWTLTNISILWNTL